MMMVLAAQTKIADRFFSWFEINKIWHIHMLRSDIVSEPRIYGKIEILELYFVKGG